MILAARLHPGASSVVMRNDELYYGVALRLEARHSFNDDLRVCSNSLFYGDVQLING